MEDLMELVAASLARHGVHCPGDSALVRAEIPADAAERGSFVLGRHNGAESANAHSSEPSLTTLPDHNYRKNLQGDPAP
jgi:hypothetical protein